MKDGGASPPELRAGFSYHDWLTPSRTARRHTAAFQIEQHPNVAAMRWREWLARAWAGLLSVPSTVTRQCLHPAGHSVRRDPQRQLPEHTERIISREWVDNARPNVAVQLFKGA